MNKRVVPLDSSVRGQSLNDESDLDADSPLSSPVARDCVPRGVNFCPVAQYFSEAPAYIRNALRSTLRALGLAPGRSRIGNRYVDRHMFLSLPPCKGVHTLKVMLASNPRTPATVLELLLQDDSVTVLERVAENPQTSAAMLTLLALSELVDVRMATIDNRNLPPSEVSRLARDESPDVRYRVAESYNTPVTLLTELAGDDNPYVARRARQTLQRREGSACSGDMPVVTRSAGCGALTAQQQRSQATAYRGQRE